MDRQCRRGAHALHLVTTVEVFANGVRGVALSHRMAARVVPIAEKTF